MKSRSKVLLALLALLLAICLFCKLCCHHPPESCACTPPNPIFTLTPAGVIIQSDPLGGPAAAQIKVKVTGDGPGNTPTLIDTIINAGSTIFVPVPGTINQINIQMEYVDESLNICPVYASLRTIFVIMDVIVEMNDPSIECPGCKSKLINPSTSPAYDMLVPSSSSHLLTLQLDNTQVNIEYEISANGNKIVINPCVGFATEESNGVIVFKSGADPIFELVISKYSMNNEYYFKFTVNRVSTAQYDIGRCNN